MKNLLLAGVLSLTIFFLGCGGSGGGGNGVESATIENSSSVVSDQFGSAVFGKTTIE